MNEKIIKLVNEKLNDIFEDYPKTADINELAEELQSDLVASAEDKVSEGKSAEDAVKESFVEFGDITELIDDVLSENNDDSAAEDNGHRIDINQSGITIDGGDKLKIDKTGMFINKGKSFKADGSGVSIGDGKIFKADENGVKLGNMTIDGRGINFDQNKENVSETFSKFDDQFDHSVDTEVYVETLDLVNEQEFLVDDVERLDIAYGSATVRVLPSNGDKIILREYMSRNNPDYFARTSFGSGTLRINQGRYPRFLHLKIRVQILIPSNFKNSMRIANSSGQLYMNNITGLDTIKATINSGNGYFKNISVNNLSVSNHSGRIKLANVKANGDLQLDDHSGSLRVDNVFGSRFDIKAHSGSIRGEGLGGSGSLITHSGTIALNITDLTGDIKAESNSGTVKLTMLLNNYYFDLQAKNGIVKSPENAILKHDTVSFKDGQVGSDPMYKLEGKASSGIVKLY
ncbi:hypothetical protein FC72_GL000911 [Companilactobacillus tucceti DSM 20183]|uniref:DUF4097 domain-containing protein n=1 Tax=Companilactobacillus tucceti DSM 20183 TaxID=1423811 RepID=A0A0R1JCH3_9LACO|nr:DUF4097 family beta strand repeat-containing protein [Companilactobacillus tucceti]KRK65442.1 hypothetical protein FC72_GL000911 [Companilactobacillus tucceti DSM 20183]